MLLRKICQPICSLQDWLDALNAPILPTPIAIIIPVASNSLVPAPGQHLASAVSATAAGPFQQHQIHPPMHGPFSQQQFANYQANPGLYPHQYSQFPPQHPQPSQYQQLQQQQQHIAAHQLQQQTQHLGLHHGGGSGSSRHNSQYAPQRPIHRMSSAGSQRGQPWADVGSGGPSTPVIWRHP
ncbi:hypothetical protein ABBQ32_003251 [Trebouxia sp. C0010 RCD-2024]